MSRDIEKQMLWAVGSYAEGHSSIGRVKALLPLYGKPLGTYHFQHACMYGQTEIARFIRDNYPVDVHAGCLHYENGIQREYALESACQANHYETVKYLVEECGADLRYNDYEPIKNYTVCPISPKLLDYYRTKGIILEEPVRRRYVVREVREIA